MPAIAAYLARSWVNFGFALIAGVNGMKIIIDGEEFEIPYKQIRLDALFEIAKLDPLKNKLALVDVERRKMVEFCCLNDVIEIFEGMCFVSCR